MHTVPRPHCLYAMMGAKCQCLPALTIPPSHCPNIIGDVEQLCLNE